MNQLPFILIKQFIQFFITNSRSVRTCCKTSLRVACVIFNSKQVNKINRFQKMSVDEIKSFLDDYKTASIEQLREENNSLKRDISRLEKEVGSWKAKYDVDTKRINETIPDLRNQSTRTGGSKTAEDGSLKGSGINGRIGSSYKMYNPCAGLFGKCVRK